MKLVSLILFIVADMAFGLSFNEAISRIENHEQVKSLSMQSQSLDERAKAAASWGDPMVKLAAKNFPKDSFKDDQTPMTGIELSISQKIPLTNKRSHLENSSTQAGKAMYWESIQTKKKLYRLLWNHAITLRKLKEQKTIIEENLQWIAKIIAVSKNLYANGKVSQQAILDLQIRKSELRSSLVEINFAIESENNNLMYLVGDIPSPLDLSSVPWMFLKFDTQKSNSQDTRELSLSSSLEAKTSMLMAKDSSLIPDLTIGVGYTKRSNIDGNGDFVSLMAQMPIPISDQRSSEYEQAAYEKMATEQKLLDYRKMKKTNLATLEIQNKRLDSEIYILQTESISFARNARKITAKAYQLGTASYVALLQSELKLQNLLLKNTNLVASRSLNTLEYKFLLGEKLHD